jgi:beta-glucosidase
MPTSYRGYLEAPREPLWPFGHGLSYASFTLTNVRVTPAAIAPDGRATVTVDVTNTGTRAGDEVVQVYVRDVVRLVTRPVRELRAFERVTLAAGEKKTLSFTLGPAALALVDRGMKRVVEPGRFNVIVGTSSVGGATVHFDVVAK